MPASRSTRRPSRMSPARLQPSARHGRERRERPAARSSSTAASRLPGWRWYRTGERLAAPHRKLHRRHRNHPVDVYDRRQPRRSNAVPLRTSHARRRVSHAGGLGALRTRIAQRQPPAVRLDRQPRVLEREGQYYADTHDAVPIRVDPSNPLDFGKPQNDLTPEEQKIGFDLVGRLNQLKSVEYPDDPALAGGSKPTDLRSHADVGARRDIMVRRKRPALYGLDDPATRDLDADALHCASSNGECGFIRVQHGAGGMRSLGRAQRPESEPPTTLQSRRQADRGVAEGSQTAPGCSIRRSCCSPASLGTPGSQGTSQPGPSHLRFLRLDGWRRDPKGGIVHGATDEIEIPRRGEPALHVTDIHATILDSSASIPGSSRSRAWQASSRSITVSRSSRSSVRFY